MQRKMHSKLKFDLPTCKSVSPGEKFQSEADIGNNYRKKASIRQNITGFILPYLSWFRPEGPVHITGCITPAEALWEMPLPWSVHPGMTVTPCQLHSLKNFQFMEISTIYDPLPWWDKFLNGVEKWRIFWKEDHWKVDLCVNIHSWCGKVDMVPHDDLQGIPDCSRSQWSHSNRASLGALQVINGGVIWSRGGVVVDDAPTNIERVALPPDMPGSAAVASADL